MKHGEWWVSPGLLTTGNDPAPELQNAERQFPDEYVPMVFMTGDGHAIPGFQWTGRGVWRGFFDELVEDNKICCHVETFADTVTAQRVPVWFRTVYDNQKVFGWEPGFYKSIGEVLKTIQDVLGELAMEHAIPLNDIRYISRNAMLARDLGQLRARGLEARQQFEKLSSLNVDPIPAKALPQFLQFIRDYRDDAMNLRTNIHHIVGPTIQQRIDEFPDHMHLITCGNAHDLPQRALRLHPAAGRHLRHLRRAEMSEPLAATAI